MRKRYTTPATVWFILAAVFTTATVLLTFNTVVEGRISSSTKHLERHIDANLKKHNLKPSSEATDAEFLRRLYLDLVGKIPPAEEVVRFLEDGSKDKREKKINELIGSERYLDHWTGLWTRWLVGQGDTNQDRRDDLARWVRSSLTRNVPYDMFVKALIAAEGDTRTNGAGNFLQYYDLSPVDLTAQISRLFLGLPMQCAQCHDHKTEPWYQRDFYGLAAFFTNVRSEAVYEPTSMGNERLVGFMLNNTRDGSISMPDTYEPVAARFLDGNMSKAPPTKQREALADWIAGKDNPYFSHAIVNRIWAHFMGRGFVEPLDGFGEEHPPTMPDLLDWLAEDFVIHGYDLQYLMKTILNSNAYQRSSEANKSNQNDETYYSRAYTKPLTAEQFFYSMLEATGFERLQSRRDRNQLEAMKRQYLERFVFLLGNGEREEVEAFNGTIPQALMMINGSLVNDSGNNKERGSLINYILKTNRSKRDRLDEIYLTILSRYPTTEERTYFDRYLRSSLYREEALAYEDLYWALLNSAEFALNH